MKAEIRLDKTETGLPCRLTVIMQRWVGKVQWLQEDARRLVWWKAVEKVRGY